MVFMFAINVPQTRRFASGSHFLDQAFDKLFVPTKGICCLCVNSNSASIQEGREEGENSPTLGDWKIPLHCWVLGCYSSFVSSITCEDCSAMRVFQLHSCAAFDRYGTCGLCFLWTNLFGRDFAENAPSHWSY